MFDPKTIKFTTKLMAGILLILLATIVVLLVVITSDVRQGLSLLGRDALESTAKSVYNSLVNQNAYLQEKLQADMAVLENEIDRYGYFGLDEDITLDVTITNQVTLATEKVRIPRLVLRDMTVNNRNEIVDKVQDLVGSVASIFQVVDGKLLRVATTARTADGTRAVGTYIPAESPVTLAVLRGELYTGKAFVVDDWYVGMYKPMRNLSGEIVAVLFVGNQILTPELRTLIDGTKAAGTGYFFVYDSRGEMLVHPTLEGQNLFNQPGIGEIFKAHTSLALAERTDGFLQYFWDNEDKVAYSQYFAPWDWHLAVGLSQTQMVRGLDVKVIRTGLWVAFAVLAGGVLFALGLVRSIAGPLNSLAARSLEVAEGNYAISFEHPAQDAIGNLSTALNIMVQRTKEMLGEINTATQALAASSSELSAISTQMTGSAGQTSTLADVVNTAGKEVGANMQSVSAAMEEGTVNMNTVAAAAEEMSATIQEIAQNSERARSTTARAVDKSLTASTRVRELGEAAKEISAVTATITAISSQTNLLALNATIEAARAGEAGRGFAVVANEIKELALQTTRATEDIREKIGGIQAATGLTVQEIGEISGVISDVNDIVGAIASAVEEQSITTRDIAENVGQASLGLTEINVNVATSASMAQSMRGDIDQVRHAAEEIATSSQTVQQSAAELSVLAENLAVLVSRFRI